MNLRGQIIILSDFFPCDDAQLTQLVYLKLFFCSKYQTKGICSFSKNVLKAVNWKIKKLYIYSELFNKVLDWCKLIAFADAQIVKGVFKSVEKISFPTMFSRASSSDNIFKNFILW